MKFIIVTIIFGLAALATGCTMPPDWNRSVDILLVADIGSIYSLSIRSVGATIRDVAKSRNVTEKEMIALFEVAWVESQ